MLAFRRLSACLVALFALYTSGCGAILSEQVRSTGEIIHARSPARHTHVATDWKTSANLVFEGSRPHEIHLSLMRTDRCFRFEDVRYTELERRESRLAPAGIALDAGILLAGFVAAFIIEAPAARAGALVGGSIPLGVDLFQTMRRTESPGEERTRREAAPAAETGSDGYYLCEIEADLPAVKFKNEWIKPADGTYRLAVTESELWRDFGEGNSVIALELGDAGQALDSSRIISAEVNLPPSWLMYVEMRRKAESTRELLPLVTLMAEFPHSEIAASLYPIAENLILLELSEELLVEAFLIAGDRNEALRAILGRRVAELRSERLAEAITAVLEASWRSFAAGREYRQRGFIQTAEVEEGRSEDSREEACELFAQLRAVTAGDLSSLHRNWRRRLSESIGADGAREAMAWLLTCEKLPADR